MRVPRFFTPEAAPGARIRLGDSVAQHAKDVLRLRPGATVHLFDGAGQEFAASIERVMRNAIDVHVLHPTPPSRPESPLRLVLAVPPLRGDRMELAIQKATELGVTEIWPVVTARTEAVGRPALRGSRQERWERVAAGACEQCGRAELPIVLCTTLLAEVLRQRFDGSSVLLVPDAEAPPLVQLPRPASLLLLVGPAGGWEPQELTAAHAAGVTFAALGPRILRTETAAIAAVSIAQALWGDLGR